MNGFQYAVAAWLPIVIFPQTMAPRFRYGFPATFGLVIAGLIAILAIRTLHLREIRGNRRLSLPIASSDDANSEGGEGVVQLKNNARVGKAYEMQ